MKHKTNIVALVGFLILAFALYKTALLLAVIGLALMAPAILRFFYKRTMRKVNTRIDARMEKLTGSQDLHLPTDTTNQTRG